MIVPATLPHTATQPMEGGHGSSRHELRSALLFGVPTVIDSLFVQHRGAPTNLPSEAVRLCRSTYASRYRAVELSTLAFLVNLALLLGTTT